MLCQRNENVYFVITWKLCGRILLESCQEIVLLILAPKKGEYTETKIGKTWGKCSKFAKKKADRTTVNSKLSPPPRGGGLDEGGMVGPYWPTSQEGMFRS